MATVARADIEALLRARKLDTTLTTARPLEAFDEQYVVATGIAALDDRLGGGLARGQLSEIVGPRSSGRTSVVMSAIASAASRGELVALVDTFDTFDPPSARACGVDLTRLLWVRGRDEWRRPESGVRRPASGRSLARLPNVRHRPADTERRYRAPDVEFRTPDTGRRTPDDEHARAIDRALKAFNLILQAGGFGLVVLDLADAATSAVRRLPFTTWFRIERPIEGSSIACVLVACEPVARSAGGVTIALQRVKTAGTTPGPAVPDGGSWGPLFTGFDVQARIGRVRGVAETCVFSCRANE